MTDQTYDGRGVSQVLYIEIRSETYTMKGATSKAYTTQFRQQQERQQGAKLEKYGPGRV